MPGNHQHVSERFNNFSHTSHLPVYSQIHSPSFLCSALNHKRTGSCKLRFPDALCSWLLLSFIQWAALTGECNVFGRRRKIFSISSFFVWGCTSSSICVALFPVAQTLRWLQFPSGGHNSGDTVPSHCPTPQTVEAACCHYSSLDFLTFFLWFSSSNTLGCQVFFPLNCLFFPLSYPEWVLFSGYILTGTQPLGKSLKSNKISLSHDQSQQSYTQKKQNLIPKP